MPAARRDAAITIDGDSTAAYGTLLASVSIYNNNNENLIDYH